jgi:hypothetical protein
MPLFCESRLPPFNIWSIEEKITWADHDIRFDEWTLKQTELLSKYWGGMMPGQGVYDRVLRKKKAGQELTEDKDTLGIFEIRNDCTYEGGLISQPRILGDYATHKEDVDGADKV